MPRLLLLGSGLAHLHVLRAWRRAAMASVELVVVAPAAHDYSGMVPGFVRGAYESAEIRIDVAALAQRAGARFVDGLATRVSAASRVVDTTAGPLEFDFCSIDVGGGAGGASIPGVREHAIALRPMTGAHALRSALDARCAAGTPFGVVVAGAGAGGVEIALAMQRRIADAGARGAVTLVDAGGALLPHEPAGLRETVTSLLRERGVGLVLGAAVTDVGSDMLQLASGAELSADIVVWLAGGEPPPLLQASDLRTDDAGYLLVDDTLAVLDAAGRVWGAGDCIALAGGPVIPRSGAYAVRQGSILLANLLAALGRGKRRRYRPRVRSLVLLDLADGRAAARWGPFHGTGTLAWSLKRLIDRRYVRQFREECDERAAPRS